MGGLAVSSINSTLQLPAAPGEESSPSSHSESYRTISVSSSSNETQWLTLLKDCDPRPLRVERLFDHSNLVILGDTDHSYIGIHDGLRRLSLGLKSANVSALLIELPEDLQGASISGISRQVRIPHTLKITLETCREAGIETIFIDRPSDHWSHNAITPESSQDRGTYMGEKIANIAKSRPNERLVAHVGDAHISNAFQIPFSFRGADNLSASYFPVLAHGQGGYFCGIDIPLMAPAVIGTLATVYPDSLIQDLLVPLPGDTGMNGVICFRRIPLPEGKIHSADGALCPLQLPSGGRLGFNELSTLVHCRGKTLPPLIRSYIEHVEDDEEKWEQTNTAKIHDFCYSFVREGALTNIEAILLASKLDGFARSVSSAHCGGSITSISYNTEFDRFEFESINNFEFKFSPDRYRERYGPWLRTFMIDNETLAERFSPAGWDITANREAQHEIEIQFKQSGAVASSALPFLIAAVSDPGRIKLHFNFWDRTAQAVVLHRGLTSRDDRQAVLAKLNVSDFQLTAVEKALCDIQDAASSVNKSFLEFKFKNQLGFRGRAVGHYSRIRYVLDPIYRQKVKFWRAYNPVSDRVKDSFEFYGDEDFMAAGAILGAKIGLKNLDQQSAQEVVAKLRDAIAPIRELPFAFRKIDKRLVGFFFDTTAKTVDKLEADIERLDRLCRELPKA